MTIKIEKQKSRKLYRYAMIIGVVTAIVCHFLPGDYQAACETIARLFAACGGI